VCVLCVWIEEEARTWVRIYRGAGEVELVYVWLG
jgi:hypothetical protein